jgi:hypothetical protein
MENFHCSCGNACEYVHLLQQPAVWDLDIAGVWNEDYKLAIVYIIVPCSWMDSMECWRAGSM